MMWPFRKTTQPQRNTVIKNVLGETLIVVQARDLVAVSCLRGKDLSHSDLRDQWLDGSDLEDTNLFGADLRGCSFARCNLRNANLAYARIEGANFRMANLDGVDLLHTNIERARLDGAIITSSSSIPGVLAC
jgi:uncharacterized protein YjbI with pentapeptide repeats